MAASWRLLSWTDRGDLGLASTFLAALAAAVAKTSRCRPLCTSLGWAASVAWAGGLKMDGLRAARLKVGVLTLNLAGVAPCDLCLTNLFLPSLVIRCLAAAGGWLGGCSDVGRLREEVVAGGLVS